MPLILRTIRKAKWYKHEGVPWLTEGELQADALNDLGTSDNTLSVWYIEDDRSNLEHVIAALAATREHVSNLDYALFDLRFLSDLGIKIEQTKGGTPDEGANSWHRDLVELSASKVVELARVIMAEAKRERLPERQIDRIIAQAITSGRINRTQLKPRLRMKIDRLIM